MHTTSRIGNTVPTKAIMRVAVHQQLQDFKLLLVKSKTNNDQIEVNVEKVTVKTREVPGRSVTTEFILV